MYFICVWDLCMVQATVLIMLTLSINVEKGLNVLLN